MIDRTTILSVDGMASNRANDLRGDSGVRDRARTRSLIRRAECRSEKAVSNEPLVVFAFHLLTLLTFYFTYNGLLKVLIGTTRGTLYPCRTQLARTTPADRRPWEKRNRSDATDSSVTEFNRIHNNKERPPRSFCEMRWQPALLLAFCCGAGVVLFRTHASAGSTRCVWPCCCGDRL